MEEAEEANLNAAFAFLKVSSDPTSRDEEVKITLDSTVCNIEDEDPEVSFWIDEEQSRQESRIVLNEAISRITEGRVSSIASSLCSNWESTSSKNVIICEKYARFSLRFSQQLLHIKKMKYLKLCCVLQDMTFKRKPAMTLRKMLLATNLKVVILDYKFYLCFPDIFRNRNSGR